MRATPPRAACQTCPSSIALHAEQPADADYQRRSSWPIGSPSIPGPSILADHSLCRLFVRSVCLHFWDTSAWLFLHHHPHTADHRRRVCCAEHLTGCNQRAGLHFRATTVEPTQRAARGLDSLVFLPCRQSTIPCAKGKVRTVTCLGYTHLTSQTTHHAGTFGRVPRRGLVRETWCE